MVAAETAVGADPGRVSVDAHRDGDAIIVEARASLQTDVEIAWGVLTGYERYAEFIPDLKSSRILTRSGSTVIVQQKGELGFLFFRFPMEVTLNVDEQPRSGITSRAIAGTFREMTGSYTLLQVGDDLQFTYSGRIVPQFGLLSLVGTAAVKAAVQKQFSALVREMQRTGALPAKVPAP
ncbi:MAG TPA: SRPBCC family protein [Burkholderiales bacterium]|nr:SRPBCC family protein [Burkholderiales bacterium]